MNGSATTQPEVIRPNDAETLDLFASKGKDCGPRIKQARIVNGLKVRLVIIDTHISLNQQQRAVSDLPGFP